MLNSDSSADIMRFIGKDDALYSEQVNRYAELFAEGEFYKDLARDLRTEFADLSDLSAEMRGAVRRFADDLSSDDAGEAERLIEALGELLEKRALIMRQLSDADTKIKQKREAMLAIEKENCMTVSAALRTIPKDVHRGEEDELQKVLREE